MRKLVNGDIIAGCRIGELYLGMPLEELIQYLGSDILLEKRYNSTIIACDYVKVWVDEQTLQVKQISVYEGFKGLFMDTIGIGSTLQDIEQNIGSWKRENDIYILQEHKGICFELLDLEEWDEKKAPIEFISIYNIS